MKEFPLHPKRDNLNNNEYFFSRRAFEKPFFLLLLSN